MTLELTEIWPIHAKKAGTDSFQLTAGNKVRVQIWESGVGISDILSEDAGTVPAGKVWTVSVVVDIEESDA